MNDFNSWCWCFAGKASSLIPLGAVVCSGMNARLSWEFVFQLLETGLIARVLGDVKYAKPSRKVLGDMSIDRNKQTVRQYVQSFNAGDIETLKKLFSSDASIEGVLGKGRLDFALSVWRELHDSLQVKLTIEEICGQGNVVAVRYSETGKLARPFRAFPGVEPTGKSYALVATEWFTFDDAGRIVSRYGARDGGSQARQVLG